MIATPHSKICKTCANTDCNFNKEKWGSTWHSDVYYFIDKFGCNVHIPKV